MSLQFLTLETNPISKLRLLNGPLDLNIPITPLIQNNQNPEIYLTQYLGAYSDVNGRTIKNTSKLLVHVYFKKYMKIFQLYLSQNKVDLAYF